MDTAQKAAYALDVIGRTSLAFATGTPRLSTPVDWARRVGQPTPDELARLDVIIETVEAVVDAESKYIAREWFIGGSLDNGETSPMEAIRNGQFDVARASCQSMLHDEWR